MLVAKGYYSQQPNIDFNETFVTTAHMETIRLVLIISTQLELEGYQLNVKSSFLNGELEKEVYVKQLEGYIVKNKEDKVYRLCNALYELK